MKFISRPKLIEWLNSDKPFTVMIWIYFAVSSIPIIYRELDEPELNWKTLDLYFIDISLPSPMYLLVIGVLVSMFIVYFNKFAMLYYQYKDSEIKEQISNLQKQVEVLKKENIALEKEQKNRTK